MADGVSCPGSVARLVAKFERNGRDDSSANGSAAKPVAEPTARSGGPRPSGVVESVDGGRQRQAHGPRRQDSRAHAVGSRGPVAVDVTPSPTVVSSGSVASRAATVVSSGSMASRAAEFAARSRGGSRAAAAARAALVVRADDDDDGRLRCDLPAGIVYRDGVVYALNGIRYVPAAPRSGVSRRHGPSVAGVVVRFENVKAADPAVLARLVRVADDGGIRRYRCEYAARIRVNGLAHVPGPFSYVPVEDNAASVIAAMAALTGPLS